MYTIREYLEEIKTAVHGKDVRQAIHDAIRQCYDDGKAGAIDLRAREDISGLDANKADKTALSQEKAERQAEIAVERERINNLAKLEPGSTTGDAELIDARVDKDGNTYDNVGEHIRQVSSRLSEENAELKSDLIQLNSEKLILCSYSIDTTNGKAYQTNTRLCNLHFIPVKNLSLVIAPENYAFMTAMYDCNNNYIGYINWRKTLSKQMISSDCCFVRLVFRLTENTNNDISENATSVSYDTKVMYSIDMITNKVWNAIENGCDNTGETDCKEIIQNALDSGLYHAFYFPSGEYYLSDYVTLRNLTSVKFHGDGIGNTIFNCGRDGFRIFGGSNITIENFDIVGSGNVDTSAIRFRDDTPDTLECRIGFSTVKNIYIRNFGVGIDFNAPSGYNYFEKVKVSANIDGSVGWAIGNTFANTGDIIPNYIYLDKCQVDGQSNINAECAISISCGQMIFINHCDFCNIVNGYGIKILNNNENNEQIQHIYMINNSIYNVKYGLFVQSRTDTQIIGIDFSHNMVVCSDVDSPTAIAILKKDDARSVIRVNIIANSITGFLSEFEKINITGVSEYSSYIAGNFN